MNNPAPSVIVRAAYSPAQAAYHQRRAQMWHQKSMRVIERADKEPARAKELRARARSYQFWSSEHVQLAQAAAGVIPLSCALRVYLDTWTPASAHTKARKP